MRQDRAAWLRLRWRTRHCILAASAPLTHVFHVQRGWEVKGGQVVFSGMEAESGAAELPSIELIGHVLTYARELERIV